tara:strand:+ start:435 stop:1082 length:648 start_codon:yes stop_codon:yes gene_type:complete
MKIKAVTFDFDGVLVESNLIKDQAFATLANEYPDHGVKMLQYHEENKHSPRKQKFEYYADHLFSDESRDEVIKSLNEQFSSLVVSQVSACEAVKGSIECLDFLKSRCELFISSVTPEPELKKILENRGLLHYFNKVFGNPPIIKRDAINTVMTLVDATAGEILFVGDSISDYQVSKEAGVHFLGRKSENYWKDESLFFVDDLLAAIPYIIENFGE